MPGSSPQADSAIRLLQTLMQRGMGETPPPTTITMADPAAA